jgi:UDP-2-acetamido-3-amino-2,3-dideoxy-glucuronate N-acetyltransferase
VAVVGAGYWGRNLVRDFHALGALGLVCDPDPGTRSAIEAAYPGLRTVDGLGAVLEDAGIAAVAIATPAPTHAGLALRALAAGRDVFVEKPLALSVEDGEAMVEAARRNGRILMVDHLLNRHPAYAELRRMVAAGELGRVLRVWSRRHNFGKIRKDENVAWSFAPHDVAMILGLVGRSPTSVEANGASYLTSGVEDIVEGSLGFDDGTTAHLSLSWLNPFKEQRLAVIGTEGMAVFDDTAPWEAKLAVYGHRVAWRGQTPEAVRDAAGRTIALEPRESLREQCLAFLGCVASRAEPPDSHGREALEVMKVLLALDLALRENRGRPARGSVTAQAGAAEAGDGQRGFFAHPTAIVDPGASVGPGTRIWHFSHVMAGARVGAGTNIGQNVVVGPRAVIGDGCKIQNNVSVYEGVTLEDRVFCGPSMVFTNVHNPRAFISRMGELRPTLVRYGASIGANATIVCGHTLGRFSFIGAGAVVASDVPDYALMVGVPARRRGWICQCGLELPGSLVCPSCGLAFREGPGGLGPLEPREAGD